MRIKRIYILWVVLITITNPQCKCVVSGCTAIAKNQKSIDQIVALAQSVTSSLEVFVKLVTLYNDHVAEVKMVTEKSVASNEDVVAVGRFWEKQMDVFNDRAAEIKQSFAEINNNALEYFNELDLNMINIPNAEENYD